MSAKRRGVESIESDVYNTPPWVVHRLLEAVPRIGATGHWLEPACGHGAIVKAIGLRDAQWTGVDLVTTGQNYLTWAPDRRFDGAITNPPFTLIFEFVQRMLSQADDVFVLGRLNLLGSGTSERSGGRSAWLRANTPDTYILPNRPSYAHKVIEANTEKPKPAEKRVRLVSWDAPAEQPSTVYYRRQAHADATEYCWFHWGSRARGGRLFILKETPKIERVDRIIPKLPVG